MNLREPELREQPGGSRDGIVAKSDAKDSGCMVRRVNRPALLLRLGSLVRRSRRSGVRSKKFRGRSSKPDHATSVAPCKLPPLHFAVFRTRFVVAGGVDPDDDVGVHDRFGLLDVLWESCGSSISPGRFFVTQ